jgi:hypothetical protein
MWTIAVLETGDDCTADGLNLQEPPCNTGGIGINHSAYELRTRENFLMTVQRRSGLAVDEQTDSTTGANENIIATDIKGTGEMIARTVKN